MNLWLPSPSIENSLTNVKRCKIKNDQVRRNFFQYLLCV